MEEKDYPPANLGYLMELWASSILYKNQVSETVNKIEYSSYNIINKY
jgi:hypothetical protein